MNMITTPQLGNTLWRKSNRSGGTSNCVEVATVSGLVGIRDSKNPHGPILSISPHEWKKFLEAVHGFH
jgi:hypothetical protein